jgi:hypothetical protein
MGNVLVLCRGEKHGEDTAPDHIATQGAHERSAMALTSPRGSKPGARAKVHSPPSHCTTAPAPPLAAVLSPAADMFLWQAVGASRGGTLQRQGEAAIELEKAVERRRLADKVPSPPRVAGSPSPPPQALLQYAEEGSAAGVRKALESGADIHHSDWAKCTALHLAAGPER